MTYTKLRNIIITIISITQQSEIRHILLQYPQDTRRQSKTCDPFVDSVDIVAKLCLKRFPYKDIVDLLIYTVIRLTN